MVNVRLMPESSIVVRLKPEHGIRVMDHTTYLFDPTLIDEAVSMAQYWAEKSEFYASTYIHDQGVASSTWTIHHNLNKFPSVSVVDSSGNEIIADVTYQDENNCTVIMTAASKGKAFLN